MERSSVQVVESEVVSLCDAAEVRRLGADVVQVEGFDPPEGQVLVREVHPQEVERPTEGAAEPLGDCAVCGQPVYLGQHVPEDDGRATTLPLHARCLVPKQ